MTLPTYQKYISQFIQFPSYESALSPHFTEYHKTAFNTYVRFKTRQENILANYLLAKENPEDKEQIKSLNTLMNTENLEMSEEELCILYSPKLYTGQKPLSYFLAYKRGKMPDEVKQKIAQSERGTKRSPEVGRKISETKRKRKQELLESMSNSFSNGSRINSNELSNKNEESTRSDS